MSPDGRLTADIGEHLREELGKKGYDVYHDHGQEADRVGEIASWFGPASAPSFGTRLSQIDIAIVDQATGETRVLIEIEEGEDKPKTILGDVLGTLISEHIAFKDQRSFNVGSWTTLIVIGKGEHAARSAFMQQRVREIQSLLPATSTRLGQVVIESYADGSNLEARLHELVWDALKPSSETP